MLGDVHILGFGMDFSEADLWWLIEYKRNHKDFCGETTFYEPEKDNVYTCILDGHFVCDKAADYMTGTQCKHLLLKETYGVKTKTLGITIKNDKDYEVFYTKAIDTISRGNKHVNG